MYRKSIDSVPVTDFFGSDIKIQFQDSTYERSNFTEIASYEPKHSNQEYKKTFSTAQTASYETSTLSFNNQFELFNPEIMAIVVVGIVVCLFAK